MYSNGAGDGICTGFEVPRASITGPRGFNCRRVFAAGTRHQERRTRSNIRLDEGEALVSLIVHVAVLRVQERATSLSPHRRQKGPGQDGRGGETHQRRGQKGISGRERKQETGALVLFPPNCTPLLGLLLRSHEPRTCTDETGSEKKGRRRR